MPPCAWIQTRRTSSRATTKLCWQGEHYAALLSQQCDLGLAEARCTEGLLLADGRVLENQRSSDLNRARVPSNGWARRALAV